MNLAQNYRKEKKINHDDVELVGLEITFLGTKFREEKVIPFQQCHELKKNSIFEN